MDGQSDRKMYMQKTKRQEERLTIDVYVWVYFHLSIHLYFLPSINPLLSIICLYVLCLSVFLSVFPFVCLYSLSLQISRSLPVHSICLSFCLSICPAAQPFAYLCVCPFVCLSVCQPNHLFIHPSTKLCFITVLR
jgi:hypothetical protein